MANEPAGLRDRIRERLRVEPADYVPEPDEDYLRGYLDALEYVRVALYP